MNGRNNSLYRGNLGHRVSRMLAGGTDDAGPIEPDALPGTNFQRGGGPTIAFYRPSNNPGFVQIPGGGPSVSIPSNPSPSVSIPGGGGGSAAPGGPSFTGPALPFSWAGYNNGVPMQYDPNTGQTIPIQRALPAGGGAANAGSFAGNAGFNGYGMSGLSDGTGLARWAAQAPDKAQ